MARHIMAVCVVCLLCADHLPCKQHDAELDSGSDPRLATALNYIYRLYDHASGSSDKAHLVKRHTHGPQQHDHHHHHSGHDHDHDHDHEDETRGMAAVRDKLDSFMVSIFKEFGDSTSMTMDVAGFENMMKRLNMYRLVTERMSSSGSGSSSSSNSGTSSSSSSSSATASIYDRDADSDDACINSVDFIKRIAIPKPLVMARMGPAGQLSQNTYDSAASSSNSSDSSSDKSNTNIAVALSSGGATSSNNISSSISPNDRNPTSSRPSTNGTITSELDRLKASIRLERDDLFNICPILLAQLASKTSRQRAGCIDPSVVPDFSSLVIGSDLYPSKEHIAEHEGHDSIEMSVWIYSTLAVLGVSLCGLLGVAVIPCMDKHFYQHALQFLVALAVGTLCGDALLHLLPHAMMATTMKNSHDEMMYKGLAAVGGIVFFYFMERFLTVVAEWYKHKEKKDKPSSRVRVMREPEASSLQHAGSGEKQCKHKYSSYPYCYDEIATETKDDHHEHNHMENHHHHNHNNHNNSSAKCANNHGAAEHDGEHVSLHHLKDCKEDSANQDNNTVSTNLDDASIESEPTKPKLQPESYTIILREHETKHHGHTHMHGHVHSPPGSLSAVAWMVIMGDGLHNFTDGMTIGAAFANNIAGGFSTAIAVFCHELPHELGDFAVLLKAGMSARDAVYYNLLSSILSFIGVMIGIVIGHQPEASAWVFSVAAGLFLYIALVDMIPELTSAHGAEDRCKTSEFLLQFFGMTSGFGIMLLIAMYEHDLKEMFVD